MRLVSVGEQATADGTATKLILLAMDVEAIGQVGEKEFDELSARVDAVGDEVMELSRHVIKTTQQHP